MSGFFVTLEGIDGSGKTTVANALRSIYRRDTRATFTFTYEPYGFGFTEDPTAVEAVYDFVNDRTTHNEHLIEPALSRGEIVVCDRYADSTRAYQGVALHREDEFGSLIDAVDWLDVALRPSTIQPDLTILYDVPPRVALSRCSGRDDNEDIDTLTRVANAYRRHVSPQEHVEVIDANGPFSIVLAETIYTIESHLIASGVFD